MPLEEYRKKRNLKKTGEPVGYKNKKDENIFVIQEHHATHLHYDFRLKISDVLKSWAIPKGIPLKEKQKRLAIETEDHPLEYANFEGFIPQGNYGAGEVIIWDKGSYENLSEDKIGDAYKKGNIKIHLIGKKIKGEYALIKTKLGEKSWLIIKK
ncbi:MAG: DNA polymerase ligase N-terminal domain-containing protein [Nanoarchaeota archaeon]